MNAKLAGGLDQKLWLGLAARASILGGMQTKLIMVNRNTRRLQETGQLLMDQGEILGSDEPAAYAGLVRNHNKSEPPPFEKFKRVPDAWIKLQLGGIGKITGIFVNCAVAIQKYGPSRMHMA
jgi:hypothetical protein